MKTKLYILTAAIAVALAALIMLKLDILKPGETDLTLSDNQFKLFEGYYNLTTDDKFYLQILNKEGRLTLRQLWDGRELKFVPKSELEFNGAGFNFELKFKKDKKGNVTEVLALGKDLWVRDDYFKPIQRVVIPMEASKLKTFEGQYVLKSNKNIMAQITAASDHLIVKQLWDNVEHKFVPESETVFFVQDNPYFHIKFIKNKQEEISQLIAYDTEELVKVK